MKNITTILVVLLSTLIAFAQPGIPEICVVTVDQGTNYNMIGWDKTAYPADSYKIYKETSPGVYTYQGSTPSGSQSVYFDLLSDPDAGTSSYKLTGVDSNSVESAMGSVHTSMFLTSTVGGAGEVTMFWTPYVGFAFTSYTIWRGSSSSTLSVIDITASTSYVDVNPITGTSCYRIEASNSAGCTPTSPPVDYSSSYSNTACETILSVDNLNEKGVLSVSVSPNPFTDNATFSVASGSKTLHFELFNMIGKKVKDIEKISASTFDVSRDALPNGVYLYKISDENGTVRSGRLIID